MRFLILALVTLPALGETRLLEPPTSKAAIEKLTRTAEEWQAGETTPDQDAVAARDIAFAFQLTGKRAYAVKVRRILGAQKAPPSPRPMIRFANAYDLVRDTMPLAEQVKFETEVLVPEAPTGPWETAAFLAVGYIKRDERMKAQAITAFRNELRDSIRADGTWYRGDWRSHFDALAALRLTRQMATRAGLVLPDLTALNRMSEAADKIRFPDGAIPGSREKFAGSEVHPATNSELLGDLGVAMLRVNGSSNTVAVRLGRRELFTNGEHLADSNLILDGKKPTPAPGRIIEWKPGTDSTLIRFSPGDLFPGVEIERTLVLTAQYLFEIIEARSTDFESHLWEWNGTRHDGTSFRQISVHDFSAPLVTEYREAGPDRYEIAMGRKKDVLFLDPGKFKIVTVPYWEVRSTLR